MPNSPSKSSILFNKVFQVFDVTKGSFPL
jgi:hypothetical protein